MADARCARCARPAPIELDGPGGSASGSWNYAEWELSGDDGEELVCPGCLTRLDHQAIAEDE
jgi:hypothetical protein